MIALEVITVVYDWKLNMQDFVDTYRSPKYANFRPTSFMPNLQLMPYTDVLKGRKPLQFLVELVEGLTGGKVAATSSQIQINQATLSFKYSKNKQAQFDTDTMSTLSSLVHRWIKLAICYKT